MNDNRPLIKRMLVGLAAYYSHALTDDQLGMYADDLVELSPEELLHAVRAYRRNPRHTRFPLPAALVSIVRPELSTDDEANETAGRIWTAISQFGYTRPQSAKAYIGDAGWEVVRLQGGWQSVCESTQSDDRGICHAQWRDLAKGVIARIGRIDDRPAIDHHVVRELTTSFPSEEDNEAALTRIKEFEAVSREASEMIRSGAMRPQAIAEFIEGATAKPSGTRLSQPAESGERVIDAD